MFGFPVGGGGGPWANVGTLQTSSATCLQGNYGDSLGEFSNRDCRVTLRLGWGGGHH